MKQKIAKDDAVMKIIALFYLLLECLFMCVLNK